MNRTPAVGLAAIVLCAALGDAGRAAPSAGGAVRVGPASPVAEDDLAGRGYLAGIGVGDRSFSQSVSQPAAAGDHAVLVGRWDDGGRGHARAVAVSGSIAYFCAGRNLKILDVSDPAAPDLLSRLELPVTIWDIAVVGSYAYLATGLGLRVLDVSNPAAPLVVGATSDPATTVAISGSVAYLAGGGYPFRIVDISNPSAPTEIYSSPALFGGLRGLTVAGEFAYTVDGDRLHILDVSDPLAPVEVGSYLAYQAYGLEVAGSLAYVVTSPALLVLDISNPAAPTLVSRTTRSSGFGGQAELDVTQSGGYLYVTTPVTNCCYYADEGLVILDVSNPAAPAEVGLFKVSFGVGVAVAGSLAFLAVDDAGLVIVDVSNPTAPVAAGSFRTRAGQAASVTVSDSMVYVGDATGPARFNPISAELSLLDASNPSQPIETGSYNLPSATNDWTHWNVAVSGSHAYVGSGFGGLRIVDVSDPAAPIEVGALDTPGSAESVAVSGSLAFVADFGGGLRIVDVSDPAAPFDVGSWLPAGRARVVNVAISGSRAYLFDSSKGLMILDVTDPGNPIQVGGGGWQANRAVVDGSILYLTTYTGLLILDATDPAAIIEVGSYELENTLGVAVADSVAYLASERKGLVLLDVSNPSAPREIGSYPGMRAIAVAVVGGYAYVAAWDQGLYIIARDADGDGVGDPTDACSGSILTPTVGFGNCDSGVGNTVFPDGCSIADRFDACSDGPSNHGQSVSCVASVMRRLTREGAISGMQQGRIQRCAAPPPPQDLVTTVTPGARVPEFVWAAQPYTTDGGGVYAAGLAVDQGGNVITVGAFSGSVDFDPGPGTYEFTAGVYGDAFVSKLDANGALVWARRTSGQGVQGEEVWAVARSVAVGGAGDVYTTGIFRGTVDFDPGPDTYNLISGSPYAAFVSKLDANGALVWAMKTGAPGEDAQVDGASVAVDGAGNAYTVGYFLGTVDFDPGPATHALSSTEFSVFVLKLDRDGGFVWVRSADGIPGFGFGQSIAVDATGNVHAAGAFFGSMDFDPGPDAYVLTTETQLGMFVWKLNAAGEFAWARGVLAGGDQYDVSLDATGNVYTAGAFYNTVDFDPGPGTFALTQSGDYGFVAKFDSAGNFVRAATERFAYQGLLAGARSIAVDGGGSVYSIGYSEPGKESFCRKRHPDGSLAWEAGKGGTGGVIPAILALGVGGTVHVLGGFNGSVDFDPGPGTFAMTTSVYGDQFLLKLGPPDSDGDGIPDEADTCPDSITAPTVILGTCDSEVPNVLIPNGCTITDRIAPCDDTVNMGRQSGCVASVLSQLRTEGVVSPGQQGRIQQCVAQAQPPL